MHKEAWSIHLAMDSIIESNNIDDDAQWLNTTLLTPFTHESAHLVGAKELSVKELAFVNELVRRRQEEEQGWLLSGLIECGQTILANWNIRIHHLEFGFHPLQHDVLHI